MHKESVAISLSVPRAPEQSRDAYDQVVREAKRRVSGKIQQLLASDPDVKISGDNHIFPVLLVEASAESIDILKNAIIPEVERIGEVPEIALASASE